MQSTNDTRQKRWCWVTQGANPGNLINLSKTVMKLNFDASTMCNSSSSWDSIRYIHVWLKTAKLKENSAIGFHKSNCVLHLSRKLEFGAGNDVTSRLTSFHVVGSEWKSKMSISRKAFCGAIIVVSIVGWHHTSIDYVQKQRSVSAGGTILWITWFKAHLSWTVNLRGSSKLEFQLPRPKGKHWSSERW